MCGKHCKLADFILHLTLNQQLFSYTTSSWQDNLLHDKWPISIFVLSHCRPYFMPTNKANEAHHCGYQARMSCFLQAAHNTCLKLFAREDSRSAAALSVVAQTVSLLTVEALVSISVLLLIFQPRPYSQTVFPERRRKPGVHVRRQHCFSEKYIL